MAKNTNPLLIVASQSMKITVGGLNPQWLREPGIAAVILQYDDQNERHRRRPIGFGTKSYRRRDVVERCVG